MATKIEVVIWDPVGIGSSSWGHVSVAIATDADSKSYSLGPNGCDVKSRTEFFAMNTRFRDGYGLTLRLTESQAFIVRRYFETRFECEYRWFRLRPQDINNCGTPVQTALRQAGVSLNGISLTPRALGINLLNKNLVQQVARYSGPRKTLDVTPPWSLQGKGAYPWERVQ